MLWLQVTEQCLYRVCARVWVCVCVCVGALVVQLVESWVYNPEDSQDTGLNPEQEEKSIHKYSSPAICKTGTWSCTGEQSTLAVSH